MVGAVGKPECLKAAWIKDGAVVVDAGYHPPGVGGELPNGNNIGLPQKTNR